MKKRLCMIGMMVCIILGSFLPIYAKEDTHNITIHLQYEDKGGTKYPIQDVTTTLTKVADESGNAVEAFESVFKSNWKDNAENNIEVAKACHKLGIDTSHQVSTNKDGKAMISKIEKGVYLVHINVTGTKYTEIKPFLIQVPNKDTSTYHPKITLRQEIVDQDPTPTDKPDPVDPTPDPTDDPDIPHPTNDPTPTYQPSETPTPSSQPTPDPNIDDFGDDFLLQQTTFVWLMFVGLSIYLIYVNTHIEHE